MTGNEVGARARRGRLLSVGETDGHRVRPSEIATIPPAHAQIRTTRLMGRGLDGAVKEQFGFFFAHANSLKENSPRTASEVSHFPAPTAVRARVPKGDVALRSASLFRTTSPSPTYTNTSAKMASAMCTVETVNGREYKVRDMAMADFGCVSDPPDGREHFPRHAFLRRFSAIAASRSTLRSARGSRDSSGLARRSRAQRYLRCYHSCNTSSRAVWTTRDPSRRSLFGY